MYPSTYYRDLFFFKLYIYLNFILIYVYVERVHSFPRKFLFPSWSSPPIVCRDIEESIHPRAGGYKQADEHGCLNGPLLLSYR